jgi:S1-C subfamily serine protease
MRGIRGSGDDGGMSHDTTLSTFSNQIADAAERGASSVVQVHGQRRPGTGLVYADGIVLTTVRALGGEEGLRVRRPDGTTLEAQPIGWDPATGLALLRVSSLDVPPAVLADAPVRVGHIALALARSWSNALTASVGVVSVIGGPLPTGRRRAIDQVIRTTAPMHDGFSGGAFLDTDGRLIGVTTAARIRGLGVVIPASIAWKTAATLLEHGSMKRVYLGIAAQSVSLPAGQRSSEERDRALLVMGVSSGSPAAAAGVLIGDIIAAVDGRAVESPEDLLDLLRGQPVGQRLTLNVLRGGRTLDVTVVTAERPRPS